METTSPVWAYRQQPGYEIAMDMAGKESCRFKLGDTEVNIRARAGFDGRYGVDAFTGYPAKESCDLVIVDSTNLRMIRNVVDAYILHHNQQQQSKTIGELADWAKTISPAFCHPGASYVMCEIGCYDLTITTSSDSGTYSLDVYNTVTKQTELTVIYIRDSQIIETAFRSIITTITSDLEKVA